MMDGRLKLIVDHAKWRAGGRDVVVTNGCFDLLHAGHVRSLEAAKAEGEFLVVLVNTDLSVRQLKGDTRPVQTYADREAMLNALRCVDVVLPFFDEHCGAEIAAIMPAVYAKSEEYRDCQHPAERKALEECGARVVWLEREQAYSSTELMARIAQVHAAESAAETLKRKAAGWAGPRNLTEVPKTDPEWGTV